MTKTVVFQSEPGIVINGSEFEIRRTEWIDQQGQLAHSETAWGRDGNTCGWFFVPPIERARLEGLGVKFSLWLP